MVLKVSAFNLRRWGLALALLLALSAPASAAPFRIIAEAVYSAVDHSAVDKGD